MAQVYSVTVIYRTVLAENKSNQSANRNNDAAPAEPSSSFNFDGDWRKAVNILPNGHDIFITRVFTKELCNAIKAIAREYDPLAVSVV